jgi:hypothetical protein
MKRRDFLKTASVVAVGALAKLKARAQTVSGVMQPVFKRGYDLANTGSNLNEKTFTKYGLLTKGIKPLFNLPMEGDRVGAEAQTLIVPSVLMNDGNVRDLAIVASMNNTVWCYDANTSDDLWMQKVGVPVNGSTAIDAWKINDHWGILSTPVVDVETNLLYLIAWRSKDGTQNTASHYLHVLNIQDGSQAQAPISLETATYTPSNGVVQKYNATLRKQRVSLTLAIIGGAKTVLWAAGTIAETSQIASGWVFAYDVATKTMIARTLSDSNYGAGIWMAGSSISIDSKGYVYLVTGNGSFDGVGSFGECAVKLQYVPPSLTQQSALNVVDWFCPYTDSQREGGDAAVKAKTDEAKIAGQSGPSMHMGSTNIEYGNEKWATVNNPGYNDQDLGSSGGCLIESLGLYLVCGKDGIVYPVNMNNMGKTTVAQLNAGTQYAALAFPPIYFTYFPGYNVSPDPLAPATLDVMFQGKTRHQHSTPVQYKSAVHGQMVFCAGENSAIRAWAVTPKALVYLAQSDVIASAQTTAAGGGMPGCQLTLSANGQNAGSAILWATIPYGDANKTVTNGRLIAFDAETFVNGEMQVLWDSMIEAVPFLYNKFNPPVVSGGKVFLPTYQDQVEVLG